MVTLTAKELTIDDAEKFLDLKEEITNNIF
jgi:hypothetical protein